jgi:hypothetical protein
MKPAMLGALLALAVLSVSSGTAAQAIPGRLRGGGRVQSAAAPYTTFITHAATPIDEFTDRRWDFAMAGRDLVCILKHNRGTGTGSGKVEVHILSRASGYKTFTTHAATPIDEFTDRRWDFAVAGRDLVCILKNDPRARGRHTASGKVEVFILTAASGYRTFTRHHVTPIDDFTDNRWSFAMRGRDLVCVLKNNGAGRTGSKKVEVHVLSGASGYRTFTGHHVTPIDEFRDDRWSFAIAGRDLLGVLKNNERRRGGRTGSGKVEVHILSGASDYKTFITQQATPIDEFTDRRWDFTVAGRDLVCVMKHNRRGESGRTGSGKVEVHILSGARE